MLDYYIDYRDCVGDTQLVGSYPKISSPYGLPDGVGNVEEWVVDWYEAGYYQYPASNDNPTGPDFGVLREFNYFRGSIKRAAAWLVNHEIWRLVLVAMRCFLTWVLSNLKVKKVKIIARTF